MPGDGSMLSYEEAASYISSIPRFTKKTSVAHTQRLLAQLGHPEESFRIIHVAGTNGKGSVCAYLESVFRTAGYRTGLFTSPHLVRVNERFRISGTDVSDAAFAEAFDVVMKAVQEIQRLSPAYEHPTYFETLFAMGVVIFQRAGVEIAVLETGMGGRLDATNAVTSPVLTVITSISLDHTQYLGHTIAEIAGEKAGIIKPGIPVIYDADDPVAEQVIRARAAELQSPALGVASEDVREISADEKGFDFEINGKRLHIPQAASYQVINASLAWTALQVWNRLAGENMSCTRQNTEGSRQELAQEADIVSTSRAGKNTKDGNGNSQADIGQGSVCIHAISDDAIREGYERMQWPCRMERVLPAVIIDGAHNADGIAQFIRTAARFHKTHEITLLYSSVSDKDYRTMIRELAEGIRPERVVTTEIAGERKVPSDIFAGLFRENGVAEVFAEPDPARAFDQAYAIRGDGMLFCIGSLYLAGEIRSYIQKKYDNSVKSHHPRCTCAKVGE